MDNNSAQKKKDTSVAGEWKILHLPSGQYIGKWIHESKSRSIFLECVFVGRAKAGHVRDEVINNGTKGWYSKRGYCLQSPVTKEQLHYACFEFIRVDATAKDSSEMSDTD